MIRVVLVLALLLGGGLLLLGRPGDATLPAPLGDEAGGERRVAPMRRVRCPRGAPGCRSVLGRIVFVERVDPDGDGDLHVVVADGGISAPGLTSVDVRPGLRPRRDPRVGDRATAAGPVQRGSFGQSQIHALRFRVRRERGR